MSNFVSGMAVVVSTLACLFSGFAAYRVFNLEQEVGVSSRSVANLEKAQTRPTQESTDASALNNGSSIPANIAGTSTPANVSPTSANNTGIQPGQFVQPTLGNLGRIELLAVKRIQDPKTGNRDVVDVLFRVYRLAENPKPLGAWIDYEGTVARNPDTSEAHGVHGDPKTRSPATVLNSVEKEIPQDGYVWLKIPEGVNTLDIYIPKTQVFKNVPIAN